MLQIILNATEMNHGHILHYLDRVTFMSPGINVFEITAENTLYVGTITRDWIPIKTLYKSIYKSIL
jgi:hypothetical protein